jgi:hypothetical protein
VYLSDPVFPLFPPNCQGDETSGKRWMEKERDDDDGIDPDEPKKNNPFEEAEVFERAGANQVAKGKNH